MRLLEWASGSSLRPYLERLADGAAAGVPRVLRSGHAREHYPRRPDGTTILPFHRLFMVAEKA